MRRKIPAPHPGDILRTEFLEPLEMSQSELSRRLKVDKRRVSEIVHGKRSITADSALRLSRIFGTSAKFWLNLQVLYDLRTTGESLEDTLKDLEPLESEARTA